MFSIFFAKKGLPQMGVTICQKMSDNSATFSGLWGIYGVL